MRTHSDETLATIAEKMRSAMGLAPSDKLDVPKLVAKFHEATDPAVRITFIEQNPAFMKGALARAIPEKRIVHYIQGLLIKAIGGDLNAVEILLEEIAHVVLRHQARVLNHSTGYDFRLNTKPELAGMETEARRFSLFSLVPISEVFGIDDPNYLVKVYGIRPDTAAEYLEIIRETRARLDGVPKQLPQKVIDFLAEKKKRKPFLGVAIEVQNPSNQNPCSRTQYTGYLPVKCANCGMMTVVAQGGCKLCRTCGDEDGCD